MAADRVDALLAVTAFAMQDVAYTMLKVEKGVAASAVTPVLYTGDDHGDGDVVLALPSSAMPRLVSQRFLVPADVLKQLTVTVPTARYDEGYYMGARPEERRKTRVCLVIVRRGHRGRAPVRRRQRAPLLPHLGSRWRSARASWSTPTRRRPRTVAARSARPAPGAPPRLRATARSQALAAAARLAAMSGPSPAAVAEMEPRCLYPINRVKRPMGGAV